MKHNTNSEPFTRMLDDLRWRNAWGRTIEELQEIADGALADYTDDPDHYSDGSEVIEWYEEYPGYYFSTRGALHLPPHRRTKERGFFQFR